MPNAVLQRNIAGSTDQLDMYISYHGGLNFQVVRFNDERPDQLFIFDQSAGEILVDMEIRKPRQYELDYHYGDGQNVIGGGK